MRLIALPLLLAALSLSGCAYMMNEPIQDVRIVTPGAHDARCNVYVRGVKYKVSPPETINITKDKEDLIVDCMAPGNRRREVIIKPKIDSAAHLNLGNGIVPGMAFDYYSGAMYIYPDIIEVNFEDMRATPEDPPAHHNPDVRQPDQHNLEEFRPAEPAMNADRFRATQELEKRQRSTPIFQDYTDAPMPAGPPANSAVKGDLMNQGAAESSVSPISLNPAGDTTPQAE